MSFRLYMLSCSEAGEVYSYGSTEGCGARELSAVEFVQDMRAELRVLHCGV